MQSSTIGFIVNNHGNQQADLEKTAASSGIKRRAEKKIKN